MDVDTFTPADVVDKAPVLGGEDEVPHAFLDGFFEVADILAVGCGYQWQELVAIGLGCVLQVQGELLWVISLITSLTRERPSTRITSQALTS